MEMQNAQVWLIRLLQAALNETKPDASALEQLTPELLVEICRLAKKHDLAHIVSGFVYENKINIEPKLGDRLCKEEILSVYRYEQMRHAYSHICGLLSQAEICHIPLKGSVLRPYYPRESMRTSCDIDILVREQDLELAVEKLQQSDFRLENRSHRDVSLFSPNNVHLELHFRVVENVDSLDAVLQDAWKFAEPADGYQYVFTKDFFAFHIFAHMSYHFLAGGCGLRSLMDIWVMEHRMGISYLCAEALLRQAGILQFAKEMHALAERCFTSADATVTDDPVLRYVIHGGVYGNEENHVAVKKEQTKTTFWYVIERVFMPYKLMKIQYPVLKNVPILLPVYWVVRGVQILFGGRGRKAITELTVAGNTSDDRLEEIRVLRNRLGL